jgi:acetoin utilization deacetylase AcuC-like enzyme
MMKSTMKPVYCTYFDAPQHKMQGHPESPQRLRGVKHWLANPPFDTIRWLSYEKAPLDSAAAVHDSHFLDALSAECQQGLHEFEPSPSYVGKTSFEDALNAAGAVLAASRAIISAGRGRAFAIVRPPGHHAESDAAMGFCLLNNIAIAAKDALRQGLKKVAIFDFDAHHGNGTEAIFYDVPEVGYFSIHEGGIYPGTGQMLSAPHARGRIINFPLPHHTGRKPIKGIMDVLVEPWLSAFQPDMLFISAGYDAHFADSLTTLNMDTKGFYQIARKLGKFADQYCQGRLLFVLEGGYDPLALQDNIHATLAALCDESDYPDHYGRVPESEMSLHSEIQYLQNLHRLSPKEK